MRWPKLLPLVSLLGGIGALAQPAEERVMELTNALRQSEAVAPLAVSPKLAAAAQEFARYMATTGQYGHDVDGRAPRERALAHGYSPCLVSENIAHLHRSQGFTGEALAAALVDGWKNSAIHRRNLLDPDVTESAVALARNDRTQRWYAVQLFGLPESARISFRVTNRADAPVTYRLDEAAYELLPGATRIHERCRRPHLIVTWPGGQPPVRIDPRNGERFGLVRAEAGGWRVERN